MLLGSGFVLLAWIALWIAGFVDAFTSDAERVRVMPKAVWVILILLFSGFAAIAWFVFGRPRASVSGSRGASAGPAGSFRGFGSSPGGGFTRPSTRGTDAPEQTGWQLGGTGGRRRSGPMAPDDDPEFLRQLGKPRRPDGPADGKPDQPS